MQIIFQAFKTISAAAMLLVELQEVSAKRGFSPSLPVSPQDACEPGCVCDSADAARANLGVHGPKGSSPLQLVGLFPLAPEDFHNPRCSQTRQSLLPFRMEAPFSLFARVHCFFNIPGKNNGGRRGRTGATVGESDPEQD